MSAVEKYIKYVQSGEKKNVGESPAQKNTNLPVFFKVSSAPDFFFQKKKIFLKKKNLFTQACGLRKRRRVPKDFLAAIKILVAARKIQVAARKIQIAAR